MADPFQHNEAVYLQIDKWQRLNKNLKAGFTTRKGGKSQSPFNTLNLGLHVPDNQGDVLSNRQILAEDINIPLESWVSGEQTHQTNIHIVKEEDRGKGAISYQSSLPNIDGIVTNRADILCTAFFADCAPLYFYDPETDYIGIAHAGWKGTVHGISEKMVDTFKSVGVNTDTLLVTIGPCISQEVYEVDENVIAQIPDNYTGKTVIQKENNRYLLDLKQLNVEILLQQGVLRHNIEVTEYCTFSDNELFFSHRRDHGKTGRMLGYIGYAT
ncbi:peptidoglycan editing factor PgeF [Virgibacillus litoralis]|uniref:Purine nucleoside phosphorylase n=1 Tax=Virgibacillus litoralis TaxID=578221 RepID=A0ABS4HIN6_9BACI|nr:peptidoglycan editing factor PgeF [Virgibacillus litoralis]MBP1950599.1 YfiH family protein [Virgibacillus litoralis]